MTEPALSFVGVWTALIALGVILYVLLDGFDLGIGMLHGFAREAADRELIMNTIAPIWDGNETWLVFCGVAFEFRFEDRVRRAFWDRAFQVGSFVAVFAQGVVLGAFIQGFRVEGRMFSGNSVDFLTPFSTLTGLALLFGYGLLGAGWLIIKTEGALQDWARRQGRLCLIGVVIGIVIVSLWTPLMEHRIAERWFSFPHILFLWPVPIATLAVVVWAWRALSGTADAAPFMASILLFLLAYLGVAISLWPMIVPYHFTLGEAASSPSTQAFLLVGALFLLPVILMYSGWSYWVFRGKARRDIGYH